MATQPLPSGSAVFEEVAAVIGAVAAHKLCEAFGGVRIYIPPVIGATHPVFAVIGAASSARLAEYYHGTMLELPKAHLRRRRVLELAERGGMTVSQIALACDYTERQVYNILAAAREDDGQMDLFADL